MHLERARVKLLRNRVSYIPLLSVMALASCQPPPPSAELSQADLTAIRATSDRWMEAVRAGRWQDVAATFTEDAVLQFPDRVFTGRAAIQGFFETMPPFDSTRTLHIDEIRGRGDMAYVMGHSTVVPPSGGTPVVVGRYLDIRLRQPDGTWLFYRDMVIPVPLPETTASNPR